MVNSIQTVSWPPATSSSACNFICVRVEHSDDNKAHQHDRDLPEAVQLRWVRGDSARRVLHLGHRRRIARHAPFAGLEANLHCPATQQTRSYRAGAGRSGAAEGRPGARCRTTTAGNTAFVSIIPTGIAEEHVTNCHIQQLRQENLIYYLQHLAYHRNRELSAFSLDRVALGGGTGSIAQIKIKADDLWATTPPGKAGYSICQRPARESGFFVFSFRISLYW